MANETPPDSRRPNNISIWVTDQVNEALTRRLAEVRRDYPYGRVSTSSYVARLVEDDLRRRGFLPPLEEVK